MAKLTALDIKNKKDPGRLADGGGLFYEITTSGVKRWLYRYKIANKQGLYVIGRYPEVSLSQARDAHNEAKKLVKSGINPAQARKKEKEANIREQEESKRKRDNLFKQVATEWYEFARQGKNKANAKPWSEKHQKDVWSSLERDVFPVVGDMPIDEIEPADLMPIIDRMTQRGVYDNTRKAIQRVNLIFNFGIIKLKCKYNPSQSLQGLLPSHEVRHHPAVYDEELGALLKDINNCPKMHFSTKLALFFTAYTVLRSKEVRLTTWDEIHWEEKELHIEPERMKRSRAHIVPLSSQAMTILSKAGELWGTEGLVFPSPSNNKKPLSDSALSKALRNLGYQGKAVVHGLRASFNTMATEYTHYEKDVIETSLAHVPRDKVRLAYYRGSYLAKRHELMQWWGDKLQELQSKNK